MTEVQFNQSNRRHQERAAREFISMREGAGMTAPDFIEVVMDLSAADGVNGNRPIDWARMFDREQVGHDVSGIHRFINRETGLIGGNFLPRCTLIEAEDAA